MENNIRKEIKLCKTTKELFKFLESKNIKMIVYHKGCYKSVNTKNANCVIFNDGKVSYLYLRLGPTLLLIQKIYHMGGHK